MVATRPPSTACDKGANLRAVANRAGQREGGWFEGMNPLPTLMLMLALTANALAVTNGWGGSGADAGDADVAAGLTAFEDGDWRRVIDHMGKVVERRPWHDNAHTLLGFAYRKLGDFPRALRHYRQALDLNPHHRGALEYLGETYLEMGQMERATAMLDRLAVACRRVAEEARAQDWRFQCEEWRELHSAIEATTR